MPWIDWFMTEEGHHLPRRVSRGVVLFGRFGFAARGLIYFSMGLLALMAALGVGGALTDAAGAMEMIGQLPLGWVLVVLTGVGLSAYALWRVAQAVFNLENLDKSAQSRAVRFCYILDGLFHAGFAVFVVMAIVTPANGNGEATREWTARLMAQPSGRWLVGLVGVAVVVSGLYLFFRSWSTRFREHWEAEHIPMMAVTGVVVAARVGEVARGVAFVLVGVFLVRSAIRFDPEEARGLGESLAVLSEQPFGRWMLAAVAVGFMAYGLYSLVDARYRSIGRGLKEESPVDAGEVLHEQEDED